MSKVWVLQHIENSYEATATILAIFDGIPSEDDLCKAGIRSTLSTELVERFQAGCNIYQCTYILDEYELTEVKK